jgi:hypothetical protein
MAGENEILMSVLEHASSDLEFRQALKANPKKVLAEAGLKMAEGVTYEVLENTPDCMHIVLPPLAPEEELGGEVLEARATKTALWCIPGPYNAVTAMPVCIES